VSTYNQVGRKEGRRRGGSTRGIIRQMRKFFFYFKNKKT
jgi:hypothetical protein